MSVTLTNTMFPHYAVISRTVNSETPPFEPEEPVVIWEGYCDCQSGTEQGGTTYRRDVYISDYTIFCESILDENTGLPLPLQTGDIVSVTFVTDSTPVDMVIEQTETANIWSENGKTYGTTIWAKRSHA